jgi:hypothetical protein
VRESQIQLFPLQHRRSKTPPFCGCPVSNETSPPPHFRMRRRSNIGMWSHPMCCLRRAFADWMDSDSSQVRRCTVVSERLSRGFPVGPRGDTLWLRREKSLQWLRKCGHSIVDRSRLGRAMILRPIKWIWRRNDSKIDNLLKKSRKQMSDSKSLQWGGICTTLVAVRLCREGVVVEWFSKQIRK